MSTFEDITTYGKHPQSSPPSWGTVSKLRIPAVWCGGCATCSRPALRLRQVARRLEEAHGLWRTCRARQAWEAYTRPRHCWRSASCPRPWNSVRKSPMMESIMMSEKGPSSTIMLLRSCASRSRWSGVKGRPWTRFARILSPLTWCFSAIALSFSAREVHGTVIAGRDSVMSIAQVMRAPATQRCQFLRLWQPTVLRTWAPSGRFAHPNGRRPQRR